VFLYAFLLLLLKKQFHATITWGAGVIFGGERVFMSQFLIQVITGANIIVSIIVLLMILANWGQPHLRHLASLAMLVTVNAIGYYLEVTAGTLEAAMVAYKVQYFAGNYSGPFLFLFAFDYLGRPIRKWPIRSVLFVIPIFVNLLVLIEPALYISDIAFEPLGETLRLVFKPGGFYIVNFAYGFAVTAFRSIFILMQFIRTSRRGMIHSVIFLGVIILPFVCKA
jgi:hypothetical protein